MTSVENPARPVAARPARRRLTGGPLTIITGSTLALFVVSAIVAPGSVSALAIQAMLPIAAVTAVAAAGQTLVVQQRGIDLSVSGTMTLSAMMFAWFTVRNETPVVVSILVVLAVAGLVGLLNGLLVARVGIAPLIGTLAVNSLVIGVMWTYTRGFQADAPDAWVSVMSGRLLALPVLVWVALLVVLVTALIAVRTVAGRRFAAAGANPAAARAAGIPVVRTIVAAYVVAAILFGVAALLLAGYLRTTTTSFGEPYLLPVIAAVVVGGTALSGGRGYIVASAVAALFLAQLAQLVVTLGAPTSVQMLVQAGAIAVAAALRGVAGFDVAHLLRGSRAGTPQS